MAERIGPYGSNPYGSNAYGSVPHLRSAPLVPTGAEKALKIVDPHGLRFPTAAEKERFCEFFEISELYAGGDEAAIQYFGGCYCAYLVPKGGAISDAQRNFANAIGRDGQNLLARAILLEKPYLILDLVACGAEVNQPCTGVNFGGGPMTPLFFAVEFRNTESIPALVRAGANIDEVRPDTLETPLIWAASRARTCIAALTLIDNGATVDCRDRQGRSALFHAIAWNDRDLVSLLIEKRAPFDSACYNQLLTAPDLLQYVKEMHPTLIEARGPDGYTALGKYRKAPPGYAAMTLRPDGTYDPGQTEAQKALKIVDPYGHHFPTKEDQTRFMDFFDIFGMDAEHDGSVLHFFRCYCSYLFPKGSITEDQRKFVKTDVNTGRNADPGPKTPLARALWLEKYDRLLDLLACGADLLAAELNHSESIPALVRAGADLNQVDNVTGETPLIRAARRNQSGAAKTLVQCGATVDCRDRQGRSALFHAIAWNDRDLVSLLIEKRAPFDSACYNQLLKAPDLLQYVKQQHPNLIALIVNTGDPALISALVNQGFDIEARRPDGYTALHVAVGNGNQAIVLQLLSLGADINAVRQPQSMTPLSFAIFGKNLSMFNLLKENGANLGLLTKVDREAYVEFFSGRKNY